MIHTKRLLKVNTDYLADLGQSCDSSHSCTQITMTKTGSGLTWWYPAGSIPDFQETAEISEDQAGHLFCE